MHWKDRRMCSHRECALPALGAGVGCGGRTAGNCACTSGGGIAASGGGIAACGGGIAACGGGIVACGGGAARSMLMCCWTHAGWRTHAEALYVYAVCIQI